MEAGRGENSIDFVLAKFAIYKVLVIYGPSSQPANGVLDDRISTGHWFE